MARLWIPFAAEKGDTVTFRTRNDAIDRLVEPGFLRHRPVQRVAVSVVVLVRRRTTP